MPAPSTDVRTLRPDIKGILQPYSDMATDRGFIADALAPAIDVMQSSGQFANVDGANVLQNVDTVRGKDGRYNQVTWQWGKSGYATLEYGLEERVDRRDAARYGSWFDAEVAAMRRIRRLLMLNREVRVAGTIFNTSSFTPTSITNEWDDAANADPIADVHAAKSRMWATGLEANALVVNKQVYDNLRVCDSVLDRIASAGAGAPTVKSQIGIEQLKAAFDLEYILVAGALKNTADEGLTASLSPVWSNEYAAICRIATNNDIEEPCAIRTFHYTPDGSEIGGVMETYYDESRRADIARVRMDVDEVVMTSAAVQLLSNITT